MTEYLILEFLLNVLYTSIMLFIIIDFLGFIPIYIGLFKDVPKPVRKTTVNLAIVASFIILVFFSILGIRIFALFGVTLHEFKIAGGILLMLISLDEVFGIFPKKDVHTEEIGVVPIASPLLAGPGAITTTIIVLQNHPSPINYAIVLTSIVIVLFIIWVMFLGIDVIYKILGKRGCLILSRIMGIILMAIAVHFIVTALQAILK